jgi:hypothetical protein
MNRSVVKDLTFCTYVHYSIGWPKSRERIRAGDKFCKRPFDRLRQAGSIRLAACPGPLEDYASAGVSSRAANPDRSYRDISRRLSAATPPVRESHTAPRTRRVRRISANPAGSWRLYTLLSGGVVAAFLNHRLIFAIPLGWCSQMHNPPLAKGDRLRQRLVVLVSSLPYGRASPIGSAFYRGF